MTLVRTVPLGALGVALWLAGCGGSDRSGHVSAERTTASTAPSVTATSPAAAPVPTTASHPTTPASGPTGAAPATPSVPADPGGASADEAQAGGAGDEEPIRQPATFTLARGDVRPATVTVAPFLPVEVTVVNREAQPRTVKLVGAGASFDVQAGGRATRRLDGLKAGTYTLSVSGGKAVATLVAGSDVGP